MGRFTPIRIMAAFGAGILAGLGQSLTNDFPFAIILGCLLLFLISRQFTRFNFRLAWMPGILANLALLVSGYLLCGEVVNKGLNEDQSLLQQNATPLAMLSIAERPVSRSGRYSCQADLLGFLDTSGSFYPVSAGVMVNFGTDSLSGELMPGDRLMAQCSIQPVTPPMNPGAFDYRRYLYFKQVRWQTILQEGEWMKLPSTSSFSFNRWSEQSRARFRDILLEYGISGQELGLAAALILGSREMLDREMVREFSNAGAIHVLSVSGLHVGIMYVLADRVLFLLKRGRLGRRFHHLLIMGIIWVYALLTGFPPSVVRASLMFSLISASKMMNRNVDGFNILAGALFLQLWNNPFDITQLGLQLSYVAVLGIFVFFKPFNQVFADRHSIISSTWSVMAVSLAAQLATFPLAGYYFHFFPVYFLITNLVVVPLAAIVVYLALVVLVAGILGIPLAWIGWPLNTSLWLMHRSVSFIQSFPGAVYEMIPTTGTQVILLYILIAGTALYFVYRQRFGIWVALIALLLFVISFNHIHVQKTEKHSLTVYSIRKHTAMDLIGRGNATCFLDSALLQLPSVIRGQIEPNRIDKRVREVFEVNLQSVSDSLDALEDPWVDPPFIYFAGKKIAFLDRNFQFHSDSAVIQVDVALITGRQRIDPDPFLRHIKAGTVVLDGSVPVFSRERWIKRCLQDSVRCHSVVEDGAFILEW